MRLTDYERAVKGRDLFDIDWVKQSGVSNEMLPTVKKRTWERKQAFCTKVFKSFFKIMLNDVIDNDVIFQAPSRKGFQISVRVKGKYDLQRIYKNPGIYNDVDLINSNGFIFSLHLYMPYLYENKVKEVRVNRSLYAKIVKRTNEGYYFCGVGKRYYRDYVDQVKELYPRTPKKLIRDIIKHGVNRMVHAFVYRKPVLLINTLDDFRAYIYTPKYKLLEAQAKK